VPIVDDMYAPEELPREIEVQILAFMRIVWSDTYADANRFRSRLWQMPGAVHLVRSAHDLLVSHVKLQPITGRSAAGDVPIAGVGGVITYPKFRGEGHATALLERAAAYAAANGFGTGMLFCSVDMVPFYERLGWRALEPGRVVVAEDHDSDDIVMALASEAPLPAEIHVDHPW
jgi:GNAT superfamily N-acetyltransferase